jgi:nucleoside-diphosphate-sugar epimerase
MNTVLVTGGAGLIGSNLCGRLLGQGERVIVIDNLITSDGSNLKQFLKNPNFKFIQEDISDAKLLIPNVKLATIYHLACPTGVPNLERLAEEMLKTCSLGTMNVLKLAKKNHANLIFTSSSEIYGDPKVSPQREDYSGNVDPVGIRSPYEEGKRFSESLIMAYVRKWKVDAKLVRVFNTYGPGASKKETRVVSVFLRHATANSPLPVAGNGLQTRTFCYVDDLVDALLLVAKRGKKGEVYNAGGDIEISIAELARLAISVTGSKSKIEFIKRPDHDHESRRPDLTKIKALGWHQSVGIYEGLKKTAVSY